YQRFIEGFSKIAKSMIKLTQKGIKFDWGEKEENAFQLIKQKICSAPILALPEESEDFVVNEHNYTTHDLELGSVVVALILWRHYLYGTKCSVFTNHKSLQHILEYKDLNMRQRRWLELLSDYDCDIRYHPGKANVVANTLSRKERIEPLRVRALVMNIGLDLSRPFKVLAKVGTVAYRLELPQEFSRVHHTFHVSILKKCYSNEPLVMPLEGIHVDDRLQFVEEPVEIMEQEIKRLKRSRIPLVKVRWNSRRGPEFTWEREDSFRKKYPHLFTNQVTSSMARGIGYENQRVVNVARARETVVTLIVQKSGVQCYNCKEYRHVSRECQKLNRAKDAAYHKEKMLLCKQEETKVQNDDDNYNVFGDDQEYPTQPESINKPYLDMCYDREHDDQDDTDELAQERDLLASLIKKLKSKIDDSKNRNKILETSNKALVDKLKDLKKFQAELDRYHDVNYASKVEIDYAKAKGDLISYKMESKKSSNEYT
nr:putative reverse transcriptase domain-containing protein [Tanacetum cinerariifolium]